jgi:PAS domain S-box-containing protein
MIVLVSRNLSARARAEVDLRLAAGAYDRLAAAILICDGAGRIEFVNKAYTQLTGYVPGDVVGRSVDATRSNGMDPSSPNRHLGARLEALSTSQ